MRRDHAAALALLEREQRRLGRAAAHAKATLAVARRFLASVAARPLGKIARFDVERFLAARIAAGCGKSMPARERSMLAVFFALLVRHAELDRSPADGVVVREPDAAPPVVLGDDAVARLLVAALEEPERSRQKRPRWTRALALRDRALVELFYAVGLRDAEARAARVVDLDADDASILVRAVKRGPSRRVPLPPRALFALVQYLGEARPLLVEGRDDPGHLLLGMWGRPLTQRASYAIVAAAAWRAGVRAHPHAFRRAIATALVRRGVPVTALQALLGHASVATTARYLAVERDELHRTVALLERPLLERPSSMASSLPASANAPADTEEPHEGSASNTAGHR